MPERRDPFAVASGDVEPKGETRQQRVKRHGLDPRDTAYASHKYGPPIEPPKPCSPEFIAAQRKIEAVIHQFRGQHSELSFREAWIEAGKSLGIDIEAIAQ